MNINYIASVLRASSVQEKKLFNLAFDLIEFQRAVLPWYRKRNLQLITEIISN